MGAFDPLDFMFEKGFRIRKQRAARNTNRDARRSVGGNPAKRGNVNLSKNAKSDNIKSVIRKSPEVVIKITGNSSGLKTVKHHLEYISRNGDVDLVDQDGNVIHGLKQIKDLRENYKNAQIPQESNKREFLHVMFSMPKGTSADDLKLAVKNFAKEEFSNRQYVMAFHGDTDKPHVHICINTRDFDRADEPRLSPRKADLAHWRQGFAEKLRELGVDAAASDRSTRFKYRKSEHSAIRQIRADNPTSPAFNKKRQEAKQFNRLINASEKPQSAFVGALRPPRTPKVYDAVTAELKAAIKSGQRPINPHSEAINKSQQKHLTAWREVARNLAKEGNQELSDQVNVLISDGSKDVISRNQALFDSATKQQKQQNISTNKEGLSI